MVFAEITSLVPKYYRRQEVPGNRPAIYKSPLTYINMHELNFAISCAGRVYLLISTIANGLRAACILGIHCLAYHHLRTCAHCAPYDEPHATEGNPNVQRKSIWRADGGRPRYR